MVITGTPIYDEELRARIEENFKIIRLCMQITEAEYGALMGASKHRVQQITEGDKELPPIVCKRLINACCCYDFQHQHLAEIVHYVILKPKDWMTLERSSLIMCQLVQWFLIRTIANKAHVAEALEHYISNLINYRSTLAPDLSDAQITIRRFNRV